MNPLRPIALAVFLAVLTATPAWAQQKTNLGDNAALRYWAAFAQMQDSTITGDEAKKLNLILDGTAPYDDLEYKDLVEKNKPALEIMALATALPNCDWGLDYQMGPDTPVEYVRKALVLGRLNVLYSYHLLIAGDKDKTVSVLAAGLRFSHDVANGGTLFATLIARDLLANHFRAIAFALHAGSLSPAQRLVLQRSLARLGPDPLDWQSAMKREMEVLNRPPWQASVPLERVTQAYVGALNDPSTLPKLEQVIATVPQPLRDVIPNPKHVLEEKKDWTEKLQEMRSKLQ
jgi:hypothetical protein